jgi:hypothetical protein
MPSFLGRTGAKIAIAAVFRHRGEEIFLDSQLVELVRTSDATMWFIGLAVAGGAIGALAVGLIGGLYLARLMKPRKIKG